jgi:hypothetical protein
VFVRKYGVDDPDGIKVSRDLLPLYQAVVKVEVGPGVLWITLGDELVLFLATHHMDSAVENRFKGGEISRGPSKIQG